MLENFRHRLASVDALPQLAMLGLLSGVLAGAVIIGFRLCIEYAQAGFLADGLTENYEALPAWLRFALPAAGGLIIGLLFHLAARTGNVQVGVIHVLERLSYHQGHLPLRNFVLQFIGATLSIVSGHSVGREGPSIHLGAASSSLLGQWLRLPNNSIQTLVACGCAAAIAASFNTPIAGVIFSMEVIMLEYTIAGFTPVILAAVSATALTRLVFGSEPAFSVPPLQLASLLELPYLLVLGLVIGTLAAVFISALKWLAEISARYPVWQRMTMAGVITGLCAMAMPEIMGIGYDTVNQAMLGELGVGVLLGVILFKMIATTVGLGLGLPGGLIGPTLVIGAAAGGVLGYVAAAVFPGDVASPGFYAMLGMGAMMGATLQAPLAALMALLELTLNPNIILPGMLAIVASGITSSHLFGRDSVFLTLLKARGLDYRSNPVAQSLRRTGIASVLNRSFAITPRMVSKNRAAAILEDQPLWIIFHTTDAAYTLLLAADLARHVSSLDEAENIVEKNMIDLMEIPAQRLEVIDIREQATLQEALDNLNESGADALYVTRRSTNKSDAIIGIITRQTIESYYHD